MSPSEITAHLERAAQNYNNAPSDTTPLIGWQIRGLVGCVSMLAAMVAAGVKFPECWQPVIEHCARLLTTAARKGKLEGGNDTTDAGASDADANREDQ